MWKIAVNFIDNPLVHGAAGAALGSAAGNLLMSPLYAHGIHKAYKDYSATQKFSDDTLKHLDRIGKGAWATQLALIGYGGYKGYRNQQKRLEEERGEKKASVSFGDRPGIHALAAGLLGAGVGAPLAAAYPFMRAGRKGIEAGVAGIRGDDATAGDLALGAGKNVLLGLGTGAVGGLGLGGYAAYKAYKRQKERLAEREKKARYFYRA